MVNSAQSNADTDPGPVLADVARTVTSAAGDRVRAVYAIGSLAHGGFQPLVSDVDVAVILTDPVRPSDPGLISGINATVCELGSDLHRRVSIFWSTPDTLRDGGPTSPETGRFPPLDRLCLSEHGRLLHGSDIRAGLAPPGRTELITEGARYALNQLADPSVAAAADPGALLSAGVRSTTKMVLFPARFLLTADTGREGTNDAAVRHYAAMHTRTGDGAARDLVRAAFTWRSTEPDPDDAAAVLRAGFVSLYDSFFTEYRHRLAELGESELADEFTGWQRRLHAAVPGG